MAFILDHIPQTPLLEGIQDWPKSCSREEWFRITRAIVAGVVADMTEDLNEGSCPSLSSTSLLQGSYDLTCTSHRTHKRRCLVWMAPRDGQPFFSTRPGVVDHLDRDR